MAVRAIWKGAIRFEQVRVPVKFYSAVQDRNIHFHLLHDQDMVRLRQQMVNPRTGEAVPPDRIRRGYEIDRGLFVLLDKQELQSIAPKKTREIDLQLFVDLSQVPPRYFQRPYFLTPAGESNKAYRLLARVMERSGQAGIASFVMRGKEYLVAILAENEILRAETLHFRDEIRGPEEVGLPAKRQVDEKQVSRLQRAIKQRTADQLDLEELTDEDAQRLKRLVDEKRRKGADLVEVKEVKEAEEPEEAEEAPETDLLETIRRSLKGTKRAAESGDGQPGRRSSRRLESNSKEQLYRQAKELGISGRSGMSKDQLIQAIRTRGSRSR